MIYRLLGQPGAQNFGAGDGREHDPDGAHRDRRCSAIERFRVGEIGTF